MLDVFRAESCVFHCCAQCHYADCRGTITNKCNKTFFVHTHLTYKLLCSSLTNFDNLVYLENKVRNLPPPLQTLWHILDWYVSKHYSILEVSGNYTQKYCKTLSVCKEGFQLNFRIRAWRLKSKYLPIPFHSQWSNLDLFNRKITHNFS